MQGRVTHFDAEKFFGFIATEADSYFFHGTRMIGAVSKGDVCDFWLEEVAVGRHRGEVQAVDVEKHVEVTA